MRSRSRWNSVRVGAAGSGRRRPRVRLLIERAGLPVQAPGIGVERALELMALDKKVQGGRIRLVLLKALGDATLTADYDGRALDAVLTAELA